MEQGFQHQVDKFVGVDKPMTLSISAFETAELTATRVQWAPSGAGSPVQFDRADGYMICLQRRDVAAQPYWIDQRPVGLPKMRPGQFLLLDLNAQHSSLTPGEIDCISVYTSRDALVHFQIENGLKPNGLLQAPEGRTHEDEVVRSLGEALLPAIGQPQVATRLYADHVALALVGRLTAQFGTEAAKFAPIRGGLAPWQERRAKEVLLAHLDGNISLEVLAAECRLSRSHFARAFKASTGVSPLRWLSRQRIEQARTLLLNTDLGMGRIAERCGYADASHFTRAFTSASGLPPGTWRRLRRP